MKTKRNKPRLAVTVDADVHAWVTAEARRNRVSLSDVVNGIMAVAMEGSPEGKKGAPSTLAVRPVRGLAAVLGGTKAGAKK